ncbi:hypothetical protein BCR33DRAFT_734897 [Rhizoclosmatium globosum]|uniref:Uncharacterized protein n=1 Tax=Rhizoclosmatium globosum TaxID=329046 RepID=A0A1Y2CQW9_9FUNG|nr:hypothetical protein BCR33DRAFT_734897 [Rhizoclosmatium globosum]|eukprot:ORY49412.1 hypothetical protein BCR33DRAFT_734897 [Rhizoclosmatium globosum]
MRFPKQPPLLLALPFPPHPPYNLHPQQPQKTPWIPFNRLILIQRNNLHPHNNLIHRITNHNSTSPSKPLESPQPSLPYKHVSVKHPNIIRRPCIRLLPYKPTQHPNLLFNPTPKRSIHEPNDTRAPFNTHTADKKPVYDYGFEHCVCGEYPDRDTVLYGYVVGLEDDGGYSEDSVNGVEGLVDYGCEVLTGLAVDECGSVRCEACDVEGWAETG